MEIRNAWLELSTAAVHSFLGTPLAQFLEPRVSRWRSEQFFSRTGQFRHIPETMSLVDILSAIADLDEELWTKISQAHAQNDKDKVFRLVGIWRTEGPERKTST